MANPFDEWTFLVALCDFLRGIDGLGAEPMPKANMQTPVAIPMLAPEFNTTWNGGFKLPIEGRILVLVKPGIGEAGNRELAEFISATGARSINQRFLSDQSLGGIASPSGSRIAGPTTDLYTKFDADGNMVYFGRYLRMEIVL